MRLPEKYVALALVLVFFDRCGTEPPPSSAAGSGRGSVPRALTARSEVKSFAPCQRKNHPYGWFFSLAQKEGFEPSRALYTPTPLAGEPLRPLGYFCTLLKDDITNQGPCQAVFAQDLARKGCFVICRHKNAGKYGLLHPPARCGRSARPAHSLRPRSP